MLTMTEHGGEAGSFISHVASTLLLRDDVDAEVAALLTKHILTANAAETAPTAAMKALRALAETRAAEVAKAKADV